eukprot:g13589.t1
MAYSDKLQRKNSHLWAGDKKLLTLVFPRVVTRSATGALLTNDVLLGYKKRGFGQGKWNGFGGKFDPETDSSFRDCARRELLEESGIEVSLSALEFVGHLSVKYATQLGVRYEIYIYQVHLEPPPPAADGRGALPEDRRKQDEGSSPRFARYNALFSVQESDEMRPQWFNVAEEKEKAYRGKENVFEKMWVDARSYVPDLLTVAGSASGNPEKQSGGAGDEVDIADVVLDEENIRHVRASLYGASDEPYFVYYTFKKGHRTIVARRPRSLFRGDGDPSEFINSSLRAAKTAKVNNRSPTIADSTIFQGGLLGYYGFENFLHVEKSLGGAAGAADSAGANGLPTTVLGEYDSFVELVEDPTMGPDALLIRICSAMENYAAAVKELNQWELFLKNAAGKCANPTCVDLPPASGGAAASATTTSFGSDYDTNFSKPAFEKVVETLRSRIQNGDFLQCVPSRKEWKETPASALKIFEALEAISQETQYRYFLKCDDFFLVGASPELQVRVDIDGDNSCRQKNTARITTCPIAGTRPRQTTDEADVETGLGLLADKKEIAEHVMLVDLARNDIGRVARAGSVRCTEFGKIRYYPNVLHICSEVVGELELSPGSPSEEAEESLAAGPPAKLRKLGGGAGAKDGSAGTISAVVSAAAEEEVLPYSPVSCSVAELQSCAFRLSYKFTPRSETFKPLKIFPLPRVLRQILRASAVTRRVTADAKKEIHRILHAKTATCNENDLNDKLVVVVGPCSVHDYDVALKYAAFLSKLAKRHSSELVVVMRVYGEKPRSTVGWKGFVNDPDMDDSCDIQKGLWFTRALMLDVTEHFGLPVATEFLDPVCARYIADVVSWGAIGARTVESQVHREMVSGVDVPCGFKNGTSGDVQVAADAVVAGRKAYSILGPLDGKSFGHAAVGAVGGGASYGHGGGAGDHQEPGTPVSESDYDENGNNSSSGASSCSKHPAMVQLPAVQLSDSKRVEIGEIYGVFKTDGNPDAHIVLRGGKSAPNFARSFVQDAMKKLAKEAPKKLLIDCSHGNASKDFRRQKDVLKDICDQVENADLSELTLGSSSSAEAAQLPGGGHNILGVMIESNLKCGKQNLDVEKYARGELSLEYGVSVTDGCVDLAETESMLGALANSVRKLRERKAAAVGKLRAKGGGVGVAMEGKFSVPQFPGQNDPSDLNEADVPALRVMKAVFPMGTVSGAPKVCAVENVREVEMCGDNPTSTNGIGCTTKDLSNKRAFFGGGIGFFNYGGISTETCIGIRTMVWKDSVVQLQAGAGIVYDSVPESEFLETKHKMGALKRAICDAESSSSGSCFYAAAGAGATSARKLTTAELEARVQELSAGYLADLIPAGRITVVRNDKFVCATTKTPAPTLPSYLKTFTHIILGPGPRSPKQVRCMLDPIIAFCVERGVPLLGICLGHQTICEYFHVRTEVCPQEIFHGKTSKLRPAPAVDGSLGSTAILPADTVRDKAVMRYHSIVARKQDFGAVKNSEESKGAAAPAPRIAVTALSDSEQEVVLAVQHRDLPIYGLQFHPESIGTEKGHDYLANFLHVRGSGKGVFSARGGGGVKHGAVGPSSSSSATDSDAAMPPPGGAARGGGGVSTAATAFFEGRHQAVDADWEDASGRDDGNPDRDHAAVEYVELFSPASSDADELSPSRGWSSPFAFAGPLDDQTTDRFFEGNNHRAQEPASPRIVGGAGNSGKALPEPEYMRKMRENKFCNFVFTCAGYPTKGEFLSSLRGIQNSKCVDAVEVGVPFSDPFADGPVIEECYRVCLEEQKVQTIHDVLDIVETAQKGGATKSATGSSTSASSSTEDDAAAEDKFTVPVILMGYLNTFFEIDPDSGLFHFRGGWGARAVEKLGIRHVIVTDITSACTGVANLEQLLSETGLELVPVLSENVEEDVIERLCDGSRSSAGKLVYATTYMGVTGKQDVTTSDKPQAAQNKFVLSGEVGTRYERNLRRLQTAGNFILMGFGITNGRDVNLCREAYSHMPHAAVIGTQYLRGAIELGKKTLGGGGGAGAEAVDAYCSMVAKMYAGFDAEKKVRPGLQEGGTQLSAAEEVAVPASRAAPRTTTPLKVCGYTARSEVVASLSDGVDFFGFNFYPKSPRYVGKDGEENLNAVPLLFELIRSCRYHDYRPCSVALFVLSEADAVGDFAKVVGVLQEWQENRLPLPDFVQLHMAAEKVYAKHEDRLLDEAEKAGKAFDGKLRFLVALAFEDACGCLLTPGATGIVQQSHPGITPQEDSCKWAEQSSKSCNEVDLVGSEVAPRRWASKLLRLLRADSVAGLLIDSKKGAAVGGNGVTWNADLVVPEVVREIAKQAGTPMNTGARPKYFFVAGGLSPDNISGLRERILSEKDFLPALAALNLSLAFDVCSGAEAGFQPPASEAGAQEARACAAASLLSSPHEIPERGHQKSSSKVRALVRLTKPRSVPTFYGFFGGAWVSQLIQRACDQLLKEFCAVYPQPDFWREIKFLYKKIANRPTALYRADNFSELVKEEYGLLAADEDDKAKVRKGATIWLKREDLLHTGAHKINNAIFQTVLAKRMGKTRIIAETGAGQHGVATAVVCAYLKLPCTIYMGAKDAARQQLNVQRIESMGATVERVETGGKTLRNAVNQTMRDWASNIESTHYVIGSCIGPAPFPFIVREAQSCIGKEARKQFFEEVGKLPSSVVGCVGGGSNCIGIFDAFVQDPEVELLGVEAGGYYEVPPKMTKVAAAQSSEPVLHAASISHPSSKVGILHGSTNLMLQTPGGQSAQSHSVSAGLDYTGVSPIHSFLHFTKRANYTSISDLEALHGYKKLAKSEGILCALETAHAVAAAMRRAAELNADEHVIVSLSGRGDKDQVTIAKQERLLQTLQAIGVLQAHLRKTRGGERKTSETSLERLQAAAEELLLNADPTAEPWIERAILKFFEVFTQFVEGATGSNDNGSTSCSHDGLDMEQRSDTLADLLFVCREVLLKNVHGWEHDEERAQRSTAQKNAAKPSCIVGTGGDVLNPHNVSTPACLVAASTNLPQLRVLKYGNVASTATGSGAADVLETLGANLQVISTKGAVEEILQETGEKFSFVFARNFFPVMKKFGPVRQKYAALRKKKSPTLFNYLGPLANPSELLASVLGCHSLLIAKAYAKVLARKDASIRPERVVIVHSTDGVDKLSPCADNHVIEVDNAQAESESTSAAGKVKEYVLTAREFGMQARPATDVYSLEVGGCSSLRSGGGTGSLRSAGAGEQSSASKVGPPSSAVRSEKEANAENMLRLFGAGGSPSLRDATEDAPATGGERNTNTAPLADFVVMNAALLVAAATSTETSASIRELLPEAVAKCRAALQGGAAAALLHQFVWASNYVGHKRGDKSSIVDRICRFTKEDHAVIFRRIAGPQSGGPNSGSGKGNSNGSSCSRVALIPEIKYRTPSMKITTVAETPFAEVLADYVNSSGSSCSSSSEVDDLGNNRGTLAAISILTEPCFFRGDAEFLHQARRQELQLQHPLPPLLMKDFFLSETGLRRAVHYEADAVLLIVSLLLPAFGSRGQNLPDEEDDAPLTRMISLATKKYGLEVVLEVVSEAEAGVAIHAAKRAGLKQVVLGVNNRDLRTFSIDLGVTEKVSKFLAEAGQELGELEVALVSFSGIKQAEDVVKGAEAGVKAFLVGTSLMAAGSREARRQKLKELALR